MSHIDDAAGPQDAAFMQMALQLAAEAAAAGEVPVGAVVVKDGVVIGRGRNSPIQSCDATAHAEINALRAAALALGNYRLDDCTLYVTLEPCAMCCGAMLHSRLKRVVFGAPDSKTGCAGSVLDLFSEARLNHQTGVQGRVLAQQAALQLQSFFKTKREQQREEATPLREDALRTPESCFAQLVDFPWQPHYVSDLPSLDGLRLHYLDEGPEGSQEVYVILHPIPGWSYNMRSTVVGLLGSDRRVVVPDLIGFGRSDKPKREAFHNPDWHLRCLQELFERLELQNIVMVVPDATHPLVQSLTTNPQYRIQSLLVQPPKPDTGNASALAARDAPYPDKGHRAAERAFQTQRK
jgi:tRNA(adenine34) deaminase